MAVEQAVSPTKPLPAEETRRLVQRIVDLPTLPIIVPQVLRIVEDHRSSAGDLAQVIGSDQTLASRILRLANSAFYGFRREIMTINHAIVLLGFDTVKSIVLAATVCEVLSDGDIVSSFNREQFWFHVGMVAATARRLARHLRLADPETAFVAGLLHDIGKVVLDRFFYRRYAAVARLAEESPCLIREAEASYFSVTHAEVGCWLAERWRFPAVIVEPIAFHHRPAAAGTAHGGLAAIVHLADIVVRNGGRGSGGDRLVPLPDGGVLQRLKIGGTELARWTEDLEADQEGVEAFLRVIL